MNKTPLGNTFSALSTLSQSSVSPSFASCQRGMTYITEHLDEIRNEMHWVVRGTDEIMPETEAWDKRYNLTLRFWNIQPRWKATREHEKGERRRLRDPNETDRRAGGLANSLTLSYANRFMVCLSRYLGMQGSCNAGGLHGVRVLSVPLILLYYILYTHACVNPHTHMHTQSEHTAEIYSQD